MELLKKIDREIKRKTNNKRISVEFGNILGYKNLFISWRNKKDSIQIFKIVSRYKKFFDIVTLKRCYKNGMEEITYIRKGMKW